MRSLVSLLLLLALCAASGASEPRRLLAASGPEIPLPAQDKAKALGVSLEVEAVQEAVEQQSIYDAALYSQQHNAAATSALFVGGAHPPGARPCSCTRSCVLASTLRSCDASGPCAHAHWLALQPLAHRAH
jgi:hypothetical protein